MSENCDVVVVGSCNVDLISYTDRFPKAGETICGTRFAMGCGGKGANQCVMAAKLGGKTAMIGCLGDDTFGDMYMKNFKLLQVSTEHLHIIKDVSTGVAPITVNKQGENSIVIIKGANDLLSIDHLHEALPVLKKSKVALFQLEISLDVTLAALKMAHKNKVTTIFNPAPAVQNLHSDFLKYSSILCCNESEAELLTGLPVTTVEESKLVLKQLLQLGPKMVVLTLGAKGAIFGQIDDSSIEHIQPKETNITAIDTTGAGDCFVGSLAYFIATRNDLSFSEMIRRSVEIASMSVLKPGTQTSYPSREDLPDDLLK